MKGAILLLAISACLRAQQGSLEGTAIHAVTREPLSNVHVRLVAASFDGITGAYGGMSDRTGHFSSAPVRQGTYILLPERAGYLHVQAKGSSGIPNITIKPGEHLQDDKGPAGGAHVVIRDTRGGQAIMRSAASGADGTYSFKSVAPGRYQLLVLDESDAHTITSEPGAEDFDDLAAAGDVRGRGALKRDLKC